ncbi:prepilin-type N-terminal cleavage/methylation domain-containing protein [Methylobrevis albus]|nr:prepilin-type N-terminal cleavage/methylation domain-containing protein [Methylobrevis albus]
MQRAGLPSRSIPAPRAARRAGGPGRDRRGGFTLMELMLAMVVIGLLAALALPRAPLSGGRGAVRADAARVVALLRADRTAALTRGEAVESRFDFDGGRLASGAGGPVIGLSRGVRLTPAGEGARSVVFTPDGRSSGAILGLSGRGASILVTINPVTAAVEVMVP